MEPGSGMALFVAVVEAHSFRAAAEQMGMTPSAVSKQLSRLEDRLGARLLNRTTRRLGLTEVGAVYYEHARRILADIEEAERAVSASQAVPRGLLRISVPLSFGRVQIAPILPEFLRRYPEVRVSVFSHDRDVDLIAEGFDAAIRVGHLRDSTMIARRLTINRRVVCATPQYFGRYPLPETPYDLDRHNCLINLSYSPNRAWSFKVGDKHFSVPVAGNMEFDNPLALREAALRGLGVVLLPSYVVRKDLREGTLQQVLSEYISEDADVFLIYPTARHMSPKLRVFMDFLFEHFADEGAVAPEDEPLPDPRVVRRAQ